MRHALALSAFVASFALSSLAFATPNIESAHKLGVGLTLGYPANGFSLNYYFSPDTSLQVNPLLYVNNHYTGFGGRVDYLIHPPHIYDGTGGDVVWYLGPGANLFVLDTHNGYHGSNGAFIGVEAAIGIGWEFAKVPIDINGELVPTIRIVDPSGVNIGGDLFAAVNARYYF